MKLIDKDALVAEIERRIKSLHQVNSPREQAVLYECKDILSFIDSLEVKEEILDEEGKTKLMKKCVHKAYKRGYDMGVLKTINEMNHNIKEVDLENIIDTYINSHYSEGCDRGMISEANRDIGGVTYFDLMGIAKHFFELGLSTTQPHINIPDIDDILEEGGIEPNSKVAKMFKESYYKALDNTLHKGE